MSTSISRLRKHAFGALMALCALALGLGLALAGCTSPGQESGGTPGASGTPGTPGTPGAAPAPEAFVPYDFTDSTGRTFTISEPLTRVAVSGPVAQQVLLSFAPDKVVELATSIEPEQAHFIGDFSALPVVGQLYGGKGNMNKEALAACAPQILIDWGEAKGDVAADMEQLSLELGIPCVHIEANLATYDQAYRMLGKLLAMEERAEEIADYCNSAYAEAILANAKLPDDRLVQGLMIIEADGKIGVIGKGSYQSQVFDMWVDNLGVFESPTAKGTGNATDMEQIATWNPSFLLCAPGMTYDNVMSEPVWASIAAVQTGNCLEIPGYPYNWMFSQPSVNQVLGMQWLPRVLYPDLFETSALQVAQEYYRLFYGYDLSAAEYAELTANATL